MNVQDFSSTSTQGERPPLVCRMLEESSEGKGSRRRYEESSKGKATRQKYEQTEGRKKGRRERQSTAKQKALRNERDRKRRQDRKNQQLRMQPIMNAFPLKVIDAGDQCCTPIQMKAAFAGDQCCTPLPMKPAAACDQCCTSALIKPAAICGEDNLTQLPVARGSSSNATFPFSRTTTITKPAASGDHTPTPMKSAAICGNDYRTPLPVARASSSNPLFPIANATNNKKEKSDVIVTVLLNSAILMARQCERAHESIEYSTSRAHQSVDATTVQLQSYLEKTATLCKDTVQGKSRMCESNQANNDELVSLQYDLPAGVVDNWSSEGANVYFELYDLLVEVEGIEAANEREEKAIRAIRLLLN